MGELLLIKLGGSTITDKKKKSVAKSDKIFRFATEIRYSLKKYKGTVVVGHGAGSFAHVPAAKYKTKLGIINKNSLLGMSIVEQSARHLNCLVVNKFLEAKLPVFTFSPASFLISDAEVYIKSYLDPLLEALEIGQIPVVYGDVVIDKKQGCTIFSTERVFDALTRELHKNFKIRMIYVSDVDGVYDSRNNTIPLITQKNFSLFKSSILDSKNTDVTGGMLHKVEESLRIAQKYKVETQIINGNIKGNLARAILLKKVKGTLIAD